MPAWDRPPKTAADLTPEEMEAYRRAAQARRAARERAIAARRQRAWNVAHASARLLKTRFGARRVWAFGSLLRRGFDLDSDVDLMVEGLSPAQLNQALEAVQELDPEIGVDLLRWEEKTLPASLRRRVEREGVEL